MALDARLVKELREMTGLPMMACKKALEESAGDVEAARERLRKQGEKVMEAKAGRQTREGRVVGSVDPNGRLGVLLSLRCETEPVAKCEDFVSFLDRALAAAAARPPRTAAEVMDLPLPDGPPLGEALAELVGRIRENIQVGDFRVLRGDAVFCYVHFDNRHGSLVALSGADRSDPAVAEAGKNLCMHVVFAKPSYMSREDVPGEEVEKERDILRAAAENDPKHGKKPPEIREKIVEGQLKRFYSERCFLEQPFVRDDKITVEAYLKGQVKGASVAGFAYVGLG